MRNIIFIVLVTLGLAVLASVSFGAVAKPAVQEAFGAEGGKNCRKDDPGNRKKDGTWGCTMYGFSPKVYGDKVPDNLDDASAMYERDFWRFLHLDGLDSQIIANAIFLAAINQGSPLWAKKIQEAVNLSNDYGEDIAVDGQIGPKTIAAANKCDQVELYVNIIILQGARYQAIVKANPNMRAWYKEWMYRMRNGVRKAVHEYDTYLAREAQKKFKGSGNIDAGFLKEVAP
jgi:lysozyme family protein